MLGEVIGLVIPMMPITTKQKTIKHLLPKVSNKKPINTDTIMIGIFPIYVASEMVSVAYFEVILK